jgi:hypothetical protein
MNIWTQRSTQHLSLAPRLNFACSADAKACLQRLQRTEDVRFSPAGDRIAFADYQDNKLLFLSVEFNATDNASNNPQIELHSPVEVRSGSFKEPHGISFLNEQVLLVANRRGYVELVDVPASPPDKTSSIEARVLGTIKGGWFRRLETPGSVASYQFGKDRYDIVVCNNYRNCVTQHKLYGGSRGMVWSNRLFAAKGINIPDGAAFSPDGEWIAISNHSTNNVLVFKYAQWFVAPNNPVARLEGATFPHGVQFTPDGQHILAVDAGSPRLFSYARPAGGWHGELQPHCVRQVLPTQTFLRGHHSPLEGGPKGLDIHRRKNIVMTTCEEDALAFFDLAEFTDPPGRSV